MDNIINVEVASEFPGGLGYSYFPSAFVLEIGYKQVRDSELQLQLELRVDGVLVVSRHRDAVEASLRVSTRRVREPRQFRDSFARRATAWSNGGKTCGGAYSKRA